MKEIAKEELELMREINENEKLIKLLHKLVRIYERYYKKPFRLSTDQKAVIKEILSFFDKDGLKRDEKFNRRIKKFLSDNFGYSFKLAKIVLNKLNKDKRVESKYIDECKRFFCLLMQLLDIGNFNLRKR